VPRRREELAMFLAVLAVHRVPPPRQQCLERGVGEGEAASTASSSLTREHREEGEHPHLDEHDGASSSVLAAVQLEIQRAVDPSDPDQGEHDGETRRLPAP
jgi:hypothetical protein